jgi:hypothetical protein
MRSWREIERDATLVGRLSLPGWQLLGHSVAVVYNLG